MPSRASDKCQREKRKTINGDDLVWAMGILGFEEYGEPLTLYLHKYREASPLPSIFACMCTRAFDGPNKSAAFLGMMLDSCCAGCNLADRWQHTNAHPYKSMTPLRRERNSPWLSKQRRERRSRGLIMACSQPVFPGHSSDMMAGSHFSRAPGNKHYSP